jgi:uncharacterized protein YndB with AHSA1/START domain
MPTETIRLVAVLPATADHVYDTWIDSVGHSKMTGSRASVEPGVGGEHTAWDGYIEGKILELEPGRRIVQSWRTSEFPLGHADSRLEVHLLDVEGGVEVTIIHTDIPEGQGAKYESGWQGHYLEPMRKHFGKPAKAPKAATPKKSVKKKAGKPAKKAAAKPAKKAASKKVAKKAARKAPARKAPAPKARGGKAKGAAKASKGRKK